MDAFLRAAATPGKSLSLAFAAARRSVFASPETGHPFYWVAFILAGNGQTASASAKTAVATAASANKGQAGP